MKVTVTIEYTPGTHASMGLISITSEGPRPLFEAYDGNVSKDVREFLAEIMRVETRQTTAQLAR